MKVYFIVSSLIIIINSYKKDNDSTNTYLYFRNAEMQYETEFQKEVIKKAINDMLSLNSLELKTQKYSNYTQKGEYWTITELIHKYFVPDNKSKSLGDRFYKEVNSEEVREQLQGFLSELNN